MARHGIDVSGSAQGAVTWKDTFQHLSNLGERPFVVAKLTQGISFPDKHGVQNVQDAKEAGFEVAVYHFGTANQDGAGQGQWFAKNVAPLADLLGITLTDGTVVKAFFDLEDDAPAGSVWTSHPLAERVARVGHCLQEMDSALAGTRTGIYASRLWFHDVFGDTDWSGRPLWAAEPGASAPQAFGKWSKVAIWQHSFQGVVAGVPSAVDLDVLV